MKSNFSESSAMEFPLFSRLRGRVERTIQLQKRGGQGVSPSKTKPWKLLKIRLPLL